MGDKLYVIVRRDQEVGIQACMAIHALQEFVMQYPEINKEWYTNSNFLGLLSAANEQELIILIEKVKTQNIKVSIYREDDCNNEITAIALEPGEKSKKLCSSFPLALKPPKKIINEELTII